MKSESCVDKSLLSHLWVLKGDGLSLEIQNNNADRCKHFSM